MKSQRPLETTTGRTTVLISNLTVVLPTLEQPLVSTQDGGSYSDSKMDMLPMKEERSLKSKVISMLRTETSLLETKTVRLDKDGESSMLMNMRRSQPRVNLTRSSAFTLKEISILFHHYQTKDTLT
jgi:hypothetical protein